jgi:hypothetical protein
MSRKHRQPYISEFTFGANRRKESMQSVFPDVPERITDSPKLPYKELIQKPIYADHNKCISRFKANSRKSQTQ